MRRSESEGGNGWGSIISLAERGVRPPPPQFAQMRGYWEALREDGALPARAAIDPRGIAGLLECSLLLERIAPGIARIRLAGMALCDLMGMELRGMPLSALILPEARIDMAGTLERVFAGPAIADIGLEAERGALRPRLSARLLLLPVTGRSGLPDRALGCLVTTGSAGRSPRRFTLTGTRITPVEVAARPSTAAAARPVAPVAQHGLAEAVAAWKGPQSPSPTRAGKGATRAYLRLVIPEG